jgi:hypothetical protein
MKHPDTKLVGCFVPPASIKKMDSLAKLYGWSRSRLLLRCIEVVLKNPKLLMKDIDA